MLGIFYDKKEKKKSNLHENNPNLLNRNFRKADHIMELLILLVKYLVLDFSRETEG